MTKPLWVLDADIRRFFDSVNHEWLLRMLSHRIADRRILRLIGQWLQAGVIERGEWKDAIDGTPQGAGISPLLANVFLHYVFDLWAHRWRKQAYGCVSVVRYADDFVMAFESEADARKMVADLTERLAEFGLALHEEKTRLIMFGKYAAERRLRIGKGRPETFDFLGFTHYCATSRDGKFIVKRKTQRKRKIRKLKELRIEAKRRHGGIVETACPLARPYGGTSVSDDARRARSGAPGQRSDQQPAKESARALSTLPHAARSTAPFGAAPDHLPPALGSRRSLPRPLPGNDRCSDIETDVARVAILRGRRIKVGR